MEREEALERLNELAGKDLRPLADEHDVTVWTAAGTLNKGWFGHTIESILGIPLNSSRNPNGGSWELKTVPLKRLRRGGLGVKETMAVTMINEAQVSITPFEKSHLLAKLRSMVVLARIYEGPGELSSTVHSVAAFDLDDPAVYEVIESDYNLVKETIRTKGGERPHGPDRRPRSASYERARTWQHEPGLLCPGRVRKTDSGTLSLLIDSLFHGAG